MPEGPRVLIPIADDSEDIETACIADVLSRAGAAVTIASVMPGGQLHCRMRNGLKIQADCMIEECAETSWDAIACPGGLPGAQHLSQCGPLVELLKQTLSENRVIGAVCASPAVVFAKHDLLRGAATSYPSPWFTDMVRKSGVNWLDQPVVTQAAGNGGCVITSQGKKIPTPLFSHMWRPHFSHTSKNRRRHGARVFAQDRRQALRRRCGGQAGERAARQVHNRHARMDPERPPLCARSRPE